VLFKRSKNKFLDYVKNEIELIDIGSINILIDQLHMQYNTDRFVKYKSLHKGPIDTVLDVKASPHYRLLDAYEKEGDKIWPSIRTTAYYKMLRLYGKSKKRAIKRVEKFIKVYESIKISGFNGGVIVVDKPIVANPYNSGYEIYEGHHRVACCIALGMETLPVTLVRVVAKNQKEYYGSETKLAMNE